MDAVVHVFDGFFVHVCLVCESCFHLVDQRIKLRMKIDFAEIVQLSESLLCHVRRDERVCLGMRFTLEEWGIWDRIDPRILLEKIPLHSTELADEGVCVLERAHDECVVGLFSLRLDHGDGILCPGDDEIEMCASRLLDRRIKYEISRLVGCDAYARHRSFKL